MKRTTAFILAALLLLSLAGCTTGTMLNTTGSTPILAVPGSSTTPSTTIPATSSPTPTTVPPTTVPPTTTPPTTTPPTTTPPTTGATSTVASTAPVPRPSRFYGEQLTVYIEGNPYIYIRYAPGTGSLTAKDRLDQFFTDTHIESIHWVVYSTEEHPDLSYVLVISGTNSSWTYRLADVTGFSAYLDTMGFTPGMSQINLFSLAESLMYEGKTVKEAAPGYFYDTRYGGGYRSRGGRFGINNDYTRSEDGTSATSYNSLFTYVPLEGMALPYDVTFADNLPTLLQKLGLNIDPHNQHISDAQSPGVRTLYDDGTATLTLKNFALYPDTPTSNTFSFNLLYTEKYEVSLTDGRISDVTRSVSMSFSGNEDIIGFISIRIQMEYPLNQG